jgi:hypothetical protein
VRSAKVADDHAIRHDVEMPNHLDFLRALDDHIRGSSLGMVMQGSELHTIAQHAGLIPWGDQTAARWTGQLVALGYVTWHLQSGSDRRPIPVGTLWTPEDIQRFGDYMVTASGHAEADRIRRQEREAATDAALGAVLPQLLRPWMDGHQQRVIAEPLRSLRAALDSEQHPTAVGAAKDLVEATCKMLLLRANEQPAAGAALPTLLKAALEATATEHSEPSGDLARSLTATVQRLAELRNAAGAGHGHAAAPLLHARDARLAASAATAIVAFLVGTVDGTLDAS